MTKEITVEQGNKLIAVFDGWGHIETPKNKGKGYWNNTKKSYAHWDLSAMKYHSSWDWLLPAWSKLYNIFIQIDRTKHERMRNDAMNFVDRMSLRINQNNSMAAFVIMLEAIQFYNSNINSKQ